MARLCPQAAGCSRLLLLLLQSLSMKGFLLRWMRRRANRKQRHHSDTTLGKLMCNLRQTAGLPGSRTSGYQRPEIRRTSSRQRM